MGEDLAVTFGCGRRYGLDVRFLWLLLTGICTVQCGVIGPPIAPEDVGVAPTIERQKRQEAARAGLPDRDLPYGEGAYEPSREQMVIPETLEDLPEPPLKTMGTR